MKSSSFGACSLALCLAFPTLICAEWNGAHHLGRWFGYGFGDGYHSCPCSAPCGDASKCDLLSPPGYATTSAAPSMAVTRRHEAPRRVYSAGTTLPAEPSSIWSTSMLPTRPPVRPATATNSTPASPAAANSVHSAQPVPMIRRLPNDATSVPGPRVWNNRPE